MSPEAFRQAFETHRDPVFRFLLRLCRDRADAEDLLQDTFVMLWRKRTLYDGRGSFEGYLKRIAFRLYLNQRTRSSRRAELAPATSAPADEIASPAPDRADDAVLPLVERVRAVVRDLPDGPREVFVLHRFEGLSCREIATLTDAPLSTVESRLRRATERVQELLRGRAQPTCEERNG